MDRTHLSDRTFAVLFCVTLTIGLTILATLPDWWGTAIRFVFGFLSPIVLIRRLRANREAPGGRRIRP